MYSSLLSSSDGEFDVADNDNVITNDSLHLEYLESSEDENAVKRKKANSDGACGGPQDTPQVRNLSVTSSRSSTPSLRDSVSRSSTPLPRIQFSSRSTTPQNEATGTANKIDQIIKEQKKVHARLNDIEQTQQGFGRKLDIIVQLLSQDHQASKSRIQKVSVPAQIAQSVRDGYHHGSSQDTLEWKTKDETGIILKYNSTINTEMSEYILTFVKGQYPNEEEGVIREGIKTYFDSMKAKRRREEKGTQEKHNKKMAVYSRMRRKLQNRKKALKNKTSISLEEKEKILGSLQMEYMSSEETDTDDEASFVVKALSWRSEDFNEVMRKLDSKHESSLSKRIKRQHNNRKAGAPSEREKPEVKPGHEWVFR